MIKKFIKAVWDLLVDIGERRQAMLKKQGHFGWY